MSANPEQFSIPEQPHNGPVVKAPHAGGSEVPADVREVPVVPNVPPLTEEVIKTTPSPEVPFDGFGGKEVILSEKEKAEFDQWRTSVAAARRNEAPTLSTDAADHETPALTASVATPSETSTAAETAPAKKNKLKRWLVAGLGAGAVFAASTALTVNAITSGITNSADKDLPPAPDTNNSGDLVPGQSGTTEQPAPGNHEGPGTDTHKFLAEDGKTFLTHEQLVDSLSVSVDEYPDKLSAQIRFYELMSKAANYDPTEEEVRNNLNIPADQQLTIDDYRAAAKLYRDTYYDSLFENKSSDLFKFLDKFGSDVYEVQIANYGASETGTPKVKYEVNLEFAETHDKVIVTDNAAETELVTGTNGVTAKDVTGTLTGTYDLTFTGFGPDQFTEDKEKVWKFGDRVVITKSAE